MGRGVLGLIVSIAEQESENTSTRVARAHRSAVEQGKPHFGGSRPFGYRGRGDDPSPGQPHSIVAEEAAVVGEVYERIMEGESLSRIAFDLNGRRVLTTRGNEWTSQSIGQMMRSPRLAGLRTHQGRLHEGQWAPILTREQHVAILAALDRTPAVLRHLLTGLVVCGTAGQPQDDGLPHEERPDVPPLPVRWPTGFKNCGKLAVAKDSLDAYVVGQTLDFLSHAGLRPLDGLPDDGELRRLLDAKRAAMAELVQERFVSRTVSPDAYDAARQQLEKRIATNEQALEVIERRREQANLGNLPLGDRPALERWWQAASIAEQRQVLARALQAPLDTDRTPAPADTVARRPCTGPGTCCAARPPRSRCPHYAMCRRTAWGGGPINIDHPPLDSRVGSDSSTASG